MWIPSILDLFEHITRNISSTLLAASAVQMLKSCIIVFAALLSVFYLKNKLYRHHVSAITLIIIGVSTVGLSMIIDKDNSNKSASLGIGMGLLLAG
jgi:drug/metabolite transporter (DMT)-like permease